MTNVGYRIIYSTLGINENLFTPYLMDDFYTRSGASFNYISFLASIYRVFIKFFVYSFMFILHNYTTYNFTVFSIFPFFTFTCRKSSYIQTHRLLCIMLKGEVLRNEFGTNKQNKFVLRGTNFLRQGVVTDM